MLLPPGSSLESRVVRVDGRVDVLGQRSPVVLANATVSGVSGSSGGRDEITGRHRVPVGVIDG